MTGALTFQALDDSISNESAVKIYLDYKFDRSPCLLAPFFRFANQSRKRSFFGVGKSRASVQCLIGPRPFVTFSSLENGFSKNGTAFVPISKRRGNFAPISKPFIAIFSDSETFFSSSTSLRRCSINNSWSGILTGQASVHAAHKLDAYGNSLKSSYPPKI